MKIKYEVKPMREANRLALSNLESIMFKMADETSVSDDKVDDVLYYLEQFFNFVDIDTALSIHKMDYPTQHLIFSFTGSVTENVAESYHVTCEMTGKHNHDYIQVIKRTHLKIDGMLCISPVKTRYGRSFCVNNPLRYLRNLSDSEIQMLAHQDYSYFNKL